METEQGVGCDDGRDPLREKLSNDVVARGVGDISRDAETLLPGDQVVPSSADH